MEPAGPSSEMTVETALRDWPATIEAFMLLRLACIGCPMARFCTLGDVARAYQLSSERLVERASGGLGERAGAGEPDRET